MKKFKEFLIESNDQSKVIIDMLKQIPGIDLSSIKVKVNGRDGKRIWVIKDKFSTLYFESLLLSVEYTLNGKQKEWHSSEEKGKFASPIRKFADGGGKPGSKSNSYFSEGELSCQFVDFKKLVQTVEKNYENYKFSNYPDGYSVDNKTLDFYKSSSKSIFEKMLKKSSELKEFIQSEKDKKETPKETKKLNDEPKVGDRIFSKNDTEIYGNIKSISGSNVEVSMKVQDDETKIFKLNISKFSRKEDGMWSFPNWTFS